MTGELGESISNVRMWKNNIFVIIEASISKIQTGTQITNTDDRQKLYATSSSSFLFGLSL